MKDGTNRYRADGTDVLDIHSMNVERHYQIIGKKVVVTKGQKIKRKIALCSDKQMAARVARLLNQKEKTNES